MTEIQQIRKRVEGIEKKIINCKYGYNLDGYNLESLKEELGAITQQIYKAVDKANKKEREELNELIMLVNIIRAKLK